jgi:hypothetical protein
MAKAGLVAASGAYSPMTLIWGGLKKEEAQHPVHQIGSASTQGDANLILQSQNLQNTEINAADAIEAATGNLNNAGDATIKVNLLATHLQHPPSTLNSSTTTTTFDALLRQPPGAYNHSSHHWNKPPTVNPTSPPQALDLPVLENLGHNSINWKTQDCLLGLPCQTTSGEEFTVRLQTKRFALVAIQAACCPG